MTTVPKRTLVVSLVLAAWCHSAARAQTAENAGLDWRASARARPAEIPKASHRARAVPSELRAVAGPAPAQPAPGQPADEEKGRRAHAAAKQTASQLLELDGLPGWGGPDVRLPRAMPLPE